MRTEFGKPSFATGKHLAAARVFADLTQAELAALAGIHIQNVERLESMEHIHGSDYSVGRIGEALLKRGILAERWPVPFVRLIDQSAVSQAA